MAQQNFTLFAPLSPSPSLFLSSFLLPLPLLPSLLPSLSPFYYVHLQFLFELSLWQLM